MIASRAYTEDMNALALFLSLAAPALAAGSGPDALFAEGKSYFFGRGVAQSCPLAIKSYEKAAAFGRVEAMRDIGEIYFAGNCVKRDMPKAREWFAKAAAAGDAQSMTNLGFIYDAGLLDGKRDFAGALPWYRKAAELGQTRAMINLGNMYRLGDGVPRDRDEALRWFRLAEKKGDREGARAARELR